MSGKRKIASSSEGSDDEEVAPRKEKVAKTAQVVCCQLTGENLLADSGFVSSLLLIRTLGFHNACLPGTDWWVIAAIV